MDKKYINYNITNHDDIIKFNTSLTLYDMDKFRNWIYRFFRYLILKQYSSFSIKNGIRFPLPFDVDGISLFDDDIRNFLIPHYTCSLYTTSSFERIYEDSIKDKHDISCLSVGSVFCTPDAIMLNSKKCTSVTHVDYLNRIKKGMLNHVQDARFNIRKMDKLTIDIHKDEIFDVVYLDLNHIPSRHISELISSYHPLLFYYDNISEDNICHIIKDGYQLFIVKDRGYMLPVS